MDTITQLQTTGQYSFENGQVLNGQSLQGLRDKINEIITAVNELSGIVQTIQESLDEEEQQQEPQEEQQP